MSDQQKYTTKLAGKRVLVIGGSSGMYLIFCSRSSLTSIPGIGYCVAEASVEQGAEVIISSSNPSRIEDAVKKLQQAYPSKKDKITGHACGLGDETTLEKNVEQLYESATSNGSKKLDHIIFTAGDALAVLKLQDADMTKIKQAGMVRFFAPLIVAKHAVKHLNEGPASSIILTTGSVSERPRPDWSIIGSFATGLHGMTRSLALDLAPIRVNLISPGGVETELWNGLPEDKRKAMFKEMGESVPTGTIGKPEDVAESYIVSEIVCVYKGQYREANL